MIASKKSLLEALRQPDKEYKSKCARLREALQLLLEDISEVFTMSILTISRALKMEAIVPNGSVRAVFRPPSMRQWPFEELQSSAEREAHDGDHDRERALQKVKGLCNRLFADLLAVDDARIHQINADCRSVHS